MLEIRDDLTMEEIDRALAHFRRYSREEFRLIVFSLCLCAAVLLMAWCTGGTTIMDRAIVIFQVCVMLYVGREWNISRSLISQLVAAKERLERLEKFKRPE